MKQKNMILVAVAVGCGLVAAFLTSKMNAKPAALDTIEIPVAAKDLSVGSRFTKDELKSQIVYKKFSKDSLPAAFVAKKEELLDKRLTRTIREGETFNPQDLTDTVAVSAPAGFDMITIRADVVAGVGGFISPGAMVDILASVKQQAQRGKAVVFPLLTNMQVLAIGTQTQSPKGEAAFANMTNVSLAVKKEDALLIHAAESRGALLKLILQNPDKEKRPELPEHWNLTDDEKWAILADEPLQSTGEGEKPDEANTPKETTVKLPVPVVDLPAGTKLTPEVIQSKFTMLEVKPPAPTNFVQNLEEHANRYLTQPLVANSFVPLAFIGEKPTVKPDATPTPNVEPKKVDPPVYFDSTVQTSNGFRKYRYQVMKDGSTRYIGEVRADGSISPDKDNKGPSAPAPKPEEEGESTSPSDNVISASA